MMPMFQSEALWLNFQTHHVSGRADYPFAIKIAAGKVNAVTGEDWSERLGDRPQDYVVALDLSHQQWTTPELARRLEQWQHRGQDLVLLVGGPEGLAPTCKQRADQVWCLSALTLPHPMVRIIVAESLYRAWSLLNNHPYHRE